MNQSSFLSTLKKIRNCFNWDTNETNNYYGVARYGQYKGRSFNPITAVALSLNLGYFPNTTSGIQRATQKLGITNQFVEAIFSPSNRGHAQVVRGKLNDVLS